MLMKKQYLKLFIYFTGTVWRHEVGETFARLNDMNNLTAPTHMLDSETWQCGKSKIRFVQVCADIANSAQVCKNVLGNIKNSI